MKLGDLILERILRDFKKEGDFSEGDGETAIF